MPQTLTQSHDAMNSSPFISVAFLDDSSEWFWKRLEADIHWRETISFDYFRNGLPEIDEP